MTSGQTVYLAKKDISKEELASEGQYKITCNYPDQDTGKTLQCIFKGTTEQNQNKMILQDGTLDFYSNPDDPNSRFAAYDIKKVVAIKTFPAQSKMRAEAQIFTPEQSSHDTAAPELTKESLDVHSLLSQILDRFSSYDSDSHSTTTSKAAILENEAQKRRG